VVVESDTEGAQGVPRDFVSDSDEDPSSESDFDEFQIVKACLPNKSDLSRWFVCCVL